MSAKCRRTQNWRIWFNFYAYYYYITFVAHRPHIGAIVRGYWKCASVPPTIARDAYSRSPLFCAKCPSGNPPGGHLANCQPSLIWTYPSSFPHSNHRVSGLFLVWNRPTYSDDTMQRGVHESLELLSKSGVSFNVLLLYRNIERILAQISFSLILMLT